MGSAAQDRRRVHLAEQRPPRQRASRAVTRRVAAELSFPILIKDRSVRRIQSLCCLSIVLATVPVGASVAAGQVVSGRVIGPDGKGIAQAVVFVDEPVTGSPKSA